MGGEVQFRLWNLSTAHKGRSLRSMDSPTASDLVKRGNGRLRADPVDESLPGFILPFVAFCYCS